MITDIRTLLEPLSVYVLRFNHTSYDEYGAVAVLAHSEREALHIIQEAPSMSGMGGLEYNNDVCQWDEGYTITQITEPGIILDEFHAG